MLTIVLKPTSVIYILYREFCSDCNILVYASAHHTKDNTVPSFFN